WDHVSVTAKGGKSRKQHWRSLRAALTVSYCACITEPFLTEGHSRTWRGSTEGETKYTFPRYSLTTFRSACCYSSALCIAAVRRTNSAESGLQTKERHSQQFKNRMADRDTLPLPLEVRARLAELELELSEAGDLPGNNPRSCAMA
ncbi:hypothetical protein AAFF_G00159810, partial [Aldrovandia affinis]